MSGSGMEYSMIRARQGFILRNLVGEYMLMPVDDNISKFHGAVLMNELSAFVWEKIQTPVSHEELLQAILDHYEVDEQRARDDLDKLLLNMKQLNMIQTDGS